MALLLQYLPWAFIVYLNPLASAQGTKLSTDGIRLNLTAELAALQSVNPAALAAQTAANVKLSETRQGLDPAPSLSPQQLRNSVGLYGAGYGASLPPTPDLAEDGAGYIGKPTAAAAYRQVPGIPSRGRRLTAAAPLPPELANFFEFAAGMGRRLQEPDQAAVPSTEQSFGAPTAQLASQPVGRADRPLPPAAVATSPGVYGLPGPDGSLNAFRDPASVPTLRALDT